MAEASVLVVDMGGRQSLSIDKGHKLVMRSAAGAEVVVENRPVTEFAGAVDMEGHLHVVALLLSRQLMYYTSAEGRAFSRSALLKSEGVLRLHGPHLWAGREIYIAYVAETEHADTLVCYRRIGDEWDGRRLAEVVRPERLAALQFDGGPGGIGLIYSVKDAAHCTVCSVAVDSGGPETITTIAGGYGDFCALTAGGVRHACWLSDGYLYVDGIRQPGEPWTCTFPTLRRAEDGVQCLWLEGGMVHGVLLGDKRIAYQPQPVSDLLPCRLSQPGESRRAFLSGSTLREVVLSTDAPRAEQPIRGVWQAPAAYRERTADRELTLTDVVHNQAVLITRMQESLSTLERSVLRQQAEVNRLNREVAAVLRSNARTPEPPATATPEKHAAAAQAADGPDRTETEPAVEAASLEVAAPEPEPETESGETL